MAATVVKMDVPCDFGGRVAKVAIYIGSPKMDQHPIFFQAKFIQSERGGTIPQEIMDSLEKLQKLALEHGVPFEELCKYALTSLGEGGVNSAQIDDDQRVVSEQSSQSATTLVEGAKVE
ncbi:hypothetical protein MIDIC_70056 [Alphaproteobacteria bacterium]